MSNREKALEAALRNIAEGNLGDASWQANYDRIRDTAAAALAMPATVDGADFLRGWKAGRDAVVAEMLTLLPMLTEHPARAVATLADHCAKLTPPEDAP
jgi:hypothetical protein